MTRPAAALSFVLLAASSAGCHWTHAPGHAERASMRRVDLKADVPCARGTCGLRAPGGLVRLSDVRYTNRGQRRDWTSFRMSYLGHRASCQGPSSTPGRDAAEPMVCALESPSGASYSLTLHRGCTAGSLRPTDPSTSSSRYGLHTDEVRVMGAVVPGREVSLLDQHGVVAYSDAPNDYDRTVYVRSGAPLDPTHLVALMAVHAFHHSFDGTPDLCLGAR